MNISIDDLSGEKIRIFLEEHMDDMRSTSPPESVHALDLNGLKNPDVTFWSVTDRNEIVACGAIKKLNAKHAEIKSMRVSEQYRGRGVASKLLSHMLFEAGKMGLSKVSLETGSMEFFEPAKKLYEKYGFKYCSPFASYTEDPNSVFMSLELPSNA